MQTLILCWIWYAPVVKHTGDCSFSVTLCKQGKNLSDNGGGFLVNNQMSFLVWVFLITVKGKCANMETVFPSVG